MLPNLKENEDLEKSNDNNLFILVMHQHNHQQQFQPKGE
jgi:hypothetical protein